MKQSKSCPQVHLHSPQPEGYLQWHDWADKMRKTHVQKQCPGCGLWAIVVPKPVQKE